MPSTEVLADNPFRLLSWLFLSVIGSDANPRVAFGGGVGTWLTFKCLNPRVVNGPVNRYTASASFISSRSASRNCPRINI
ncbi:hypothetical protein GGS20DRAFT_437574 [Poronia punctata]|nr:hypothetical protein GGS20DRAFT_437574 [Poronia punctata]